MFEPRKLSPQARAIFSDPTNTLLVSICSLWEITIEVAIEKMTIPGADIDSVLENLDAFRIRTLPVRPRHLQALQLLPHHHGDPFDRMLIAQSQSEGLPLISKDEDIRLYSLEVIR